MAKAYDLGMPDLLTAKQVAVHFSVGIDTVYRWIAEARITAERTPGGRIRIRRDEVERWEQNR